MRGKGMAVRRSLLALLCGLTVTYTAVAPSVTLTAYADETKEDHKDPDTGSQSGAEPDYSQTPAGAEADYTSDYRYGVQLYGILQGKVSDEGAQAGLTFGPRTGDHSEVDHHHTPSGETANGHPHRCIHDDSWEQIAQLSYQDPYIYEQCLENGCTKAVSLTFTEDNSGGSSDADAGKVFNTETARKSTGDGYGALYWELQDNARYYSTPAGDANLSWGVSQIRAMLNGIQDEDNAYSNNTYNTSNSLLSAFPSALTEAIALRDIDYATSYRTDASIEQSSDLLWLFSISEYYGTDSLSGYKNGGGNYHEGEQYTKTAGYNVSGQNAAAVAYKSNGTKASYWLRSRFYSAATNEYAAYVTASGRLGSSDGNYSTIAVAPGFTLKCDADFQPADPKDPETPKDPDPSTPTDPKDPETPKDPDPSTPTDPEQPSEPSQPENPGSGDSGSSDSGSGDSGGGDSSGSSDHASSTSSGTTSDPTATTVTTTTATTATTTDVAVTVDATEVTAEASTTAVAATETTVAENTTETAAGNGNAAVSRTGDDSLIHAYAGTAVLAAIVVTIWTIRYTKRSRMI